jgi:DNA polymerase-1
MPDELAVQMPVLREVLDAMNIPRYELAGYEADDIIGTVARICSEEGHECVVVTGDRDSLQLVGGNVRVKLVSTRQGQTIETDYTEDKFKEDYGFPPRLMVDLKALMGDPSDNIPGVRGVGEKTARELICRFGTIDEIFKNLEALDIRESVKQKLREGIEAARMSYELATIDRHVPIDIAPESNIIHEPDSRRLYELFIRLEFNKLIERLELTPDEAAQPAKEAAAREAEIVSSPARARELIDKWRHVPRAAVLCAPELAAVAVYDGEAACVFLKNGFEGDYFALLADIFSAEVQKCSHDVKELMRVLLENGIESGGFEFDSALGAYLLDPAATSYSLEQLSVRYLHRELPGGRLFTAKDAFAPLGDIKTSADALCKHAAACLELEAALRTLLREQEMEELLRDVELPLCAVLADMEYRGFLVDAAALREFGSMLSNRIADLEKEIYNLAGGPFNINSTQQLGKLLFEGLGLPPVKKTKTGYSTDAEVLEKLRGSHPIIDLILEYRQLTKLKSTYADGLIKVIAPDGRIHTSFQMTVTTTGRLSSTDPNLQNIPVRTKLGSELRKMFVAAPGCVLVDADYSQIELRILAHIADDAAMIETFKTGGDIHAVTASQVLNIPLSEVTPAQRSSAKAVNFGIVYGISDFSLSQDIGVTRAQARRYIDSYLAKYSGVRDYMKSIVEKARADGYVSTILGRRRPVPELKSSNYNIRSFGERVALNTPIQGSAADIIKLAMIHVHERLKKENMRARLILQVHDELIIEAPEDEARRAGEILCEEMMSVAKLRVPLIAEAKSGRSWYDAH